MGRSGSYLNSSITSAWSEHSLDPEDIREELKKLYSQLEIYKRKKMLANNPHLQKKRSSKKGLGRSLMRRITEIPESVHRQCSREDKETGDHGSNRNSICMLKKNPLDPSHQVKPAKEETLKNKVFSLKKSHSSYDHVRDQNEDANRAAAEKVEMATTEGSLLDTLMGKKLVKKKSSENINAPSESTECVPLVCKSASAHNLTADKKPIHPRASMLQKSLSVIASAKEKTLGLTGKTQSSEDSNKKSQPKSKDMSAETENDCQPKMIISQSVEYKQSTAKGRIMKQPVTGSRPTICSDPVRGKDLYDVSEVCPWELEDLPTPSENKIQKHVSIAPKETTTIHGGSTKGSKSQKQKASHQSPLSSRTKENQRTTAVQAEVCPWEEEDKRLSQQKLSEVCPWDVECPQEGLQIEKRKSANVGAAKPKQAEVCPWDFEDTSSKTGTDKSAPVEKQSNPNSKGAAASSAKKAEVCPWDFDETKSGKKA
ncbi:hypothetical protein GOODEAATRI_019828 [Goodea atripinnis]|uniref:Uncharacterized protein n=1 Tax=Goodea atripinnis TaxID=208336 RepID=A0ABV0NFD6_9TELE